MLIWFFWPWKLPLHSTTERTPCTTEYSRTLDLHYSHYSLLEGQPKHCRTVDRLLNRQLLCMHCPLLQLGSTASFTAHYFSIPSTVLDSSFTALLCISTVAFQLRPLRVCRGSPSSASSLGSKTNTATIGTTQCYVVLWSGLRVCWCSEPNLYCYAKQWP
jgi:hypothetical protein